MDDKTLERRIERAREVADEAEAWIEEHADAWLWIVHACLGEVAAQRKFSMRWALEEARKRDFASFTTGRTYVNNSFGAPMARKLQTEYPQVKPYIELRKSVLDLA